MALLQENPEYGDQSVTVFQDFSFRLPAFRITECPADTCFMAKQSFILPGNLAECGALLWSNIRDYFRGCSGLMGTTGYTYHTG